MEAGKAKIAAKRQTAVKPDRILVRGVNWLGDSVMTTPALRRLKESYPEASISLLTLKSFADLWLKNPHIDQVLTFEKTEPSRDISAKIKQEKYDLAVVFPNSFRSALECKRAGIPRRVGFPGQWRRWLLTDPVEKDHSLMRMKKPSMKEILRRTDQEGTLSRPVFPLKAHHVFHYLRIIEYLGGNPEPVNPTIQVDEEEVVNFGRNFLSSPKEQKTGATLIGIIPGAEYGPAKRWPEKYFVETAVALLKNREVRLVIFGGPGDLNTGERICRSVQSQRKGSDDSPDLIKNLAGKTSLRQLCAGLKACRIVLTNDTGPMHVASAVGTRVVIPFGSTSWELTGPGLPGQDRHALVYVPTPCAPCYLKECPIDFPCMENLKPEKILQELLNRI